MRFGLHVPQLGTLGEPTALVELAGRAEAAGWDGWARPGTGRIDKAAAKNSMYVILHTMKVDILICN